MYLLPMDSIRKVLAGNVRELRSKRGWTQEKLAEKSNISWSSVAYIETERQWPAPETLEKVAKAFGVKVGRLFSDPDVPPEPTPQEAVEVIAKMVGLEVRPPRRARKPSKPPDA